MIELFSVILGHQGRATFENLSRYSHLTELTFRRWFAGHFALAGLQPGLREAILWRVHQRGRLELPAQLWLCNLRTGQVLVLVRGQVPLLRRSSFNVFPMLSQIY